MLRRLADLTVARYRRGVDGILAAAAKGSPVA